jgi:hypothetical protein
VTKKKRFLHPQSQISALIRAWTFAFKPPFAPVTDPASFWLSDGLTGDGTRNVGENLDKKRKSEYIYIIQIKQLVCKGEIGHVRHLCHWRYID